MSVFSTHFTRILVLLCVICLPRALPAQEAAGEAELLARLADPDNAEWESAEEEILDAWSRSGSTAMDLLLKRGEEALEAEDFAAAIEHFTALTDHAPNFAEAWNMRATAFFMIEEYGLSIEDISRALALNPNHYSALGGLGVILEQLGENEEALLAYRASFAINPHQENLSEAIERLEALVEGSQI